MKKSQNKAQTRYRFAFITGASAGIGEATALQMAENKYSLVLTARRLDRLKKLAALCLKAGAPQVVCHALDITKPKDILRVAQKLKADGIQISVLVNNAGLAKGVELFQNSKQAEMDDMVDTNVKALFMCGSKAKSKICSAKTRRYLMPITACVPKATRRPKATHTANLKA